MSFAFAPPSPATTPIALVTPGGWAEGAGRLSEARRAQAAEIGFLPKPGRHCVLPRFGEENGLVLFGVDGPDSVNRDPLAPGRLATLLPPGSYQFDAEAVEQPLAELSWALSSYRFTRYKTPVGEVARLCASRGLETERIERIAAGTTLGRDLVNTPANDMGPEALEAAAVALAGRYGAACHVVRGEDLATGFPLIQAVGQAAHQPPRLVDFTWGDADAPAVTLVGKGVTFDTGGLNIKPDAGMLLMKKDMGGAAAALSLALMIMDAGLRLRLRVLLPVVENAISAASFRPGDIYRSRKGLTVEIGNTDAEGRLILADALALACEEKPALILDFATLTGAARVALGPDLPPFFTGDDKLAETLLAHGRATCDPIWRLPLWQPYDSLLEGKVSDLSNIGGNAFAGSIVAALFLRHFVEPQQAWVHFDIFGWNPTAKPARPEGGEVQTVRLLYDLLETRYPA